MKKRITTNNCVHFIMRISVPFMLILLLAGISYARNSLAQEVLSRKVSIEAENAELKTVLNHISKSSKVRFSYVLGLVSSHKVTISARNEKLESVLEKVLSPLRISYYVTDDLIVLNKEREPEPVKTGLSDKENAALDPTGVEKTVSGQVLAENGDPLPGVNITIKGTTMGTSANANGRYSLSIKEENVTLVFSFVGFISQEIAMNGRSLIDVKLLADTKVLDAAVVIGYGTSTKKDLSGAISSISAKDFRNHPMNDFSQVLQGRAAGIAVTNTTGNPGQSAKIRIRGANSLSGGNEPLIIIDGVPAMYDINVNDIKSVEILKDASATAIYGSRGANGVILISTLRGDPGAPKLTLTSNIGFSKVRKKYDLLEAPEYATLANTTYKKEMYTQDQITGFKQNGGTNWQDEIFRTGLSQNYQASISGGAANVRYLISANHINETGTLINTDRKKYSFRTNLNADLSKRLSMSLDINAVQNERNNPDLGSGGSKENPIYQSLLWSPTEPIYNADGVTYTAADRIGALGKNPLLLAKEPFNYTKSQNTNITTNLKYMLLKSLSFTGTASINRSVTSSKSFSNKVQSLSNPTTLTENSGEGTYWQLQAYMNYSRTFFTKHVVSAVAGFEESANESRSIRGSIRGVDSPTANLANGTTPAFTHSYGYSALQSYFARVNYNYMGKYYVTATYRADGSSKFRKQNKFGFFPSVGLSWVASEEGFIKNLNIFDNLKFRGTWGVTGNQAIASYATFSKLANETYAFGSAIKYTGTKPSGPANTNLRWEETTQKDIGLDAAFLNNRINVSLDYFVKQTNGVLLARNLPLYDGGYSATQNIGRIDNKGFELSLDYLVFNKGPFSWDLGFNFSTVKNKVVHLGGETRIFGGSYGSGVMNTNAFVIMPGESLGSFWGYRYLGIWGTGEAEKALPYGNQPGDSKYEDINKDNKIDANDYQIIGNANPAFSWGFSNTLNYKNFGLDILFQGVQGREVYNITYASAAVLIPDSRTITLKEAADLWTPANPNAAWPAVSTTNKNFMSSSRWLQNGSYIKIRNISLNYTLPKSINKIADIKLSVSGQNLFTITKYKGIDPEVSSSGGSDIDSGIDFGVYPTSKLITAGLTITF